MSTAIAHKAAATDALWSNDRSTAIGIFPNVRNLAATHDFEHMFRLPLSEDAAGKTPNATGFGCAGLFSNSLVRDFPVSSADLDPRVNRRNRILASLIPTSSIGKHTGYDRRRHGARTGFASDNSVGAVRKASLFGSWPKAGGLSSLYKQNHEKLTVYNREYAQFFTGALSRVAAGSFGHADSVKSRLDDLTFSVNVGGFSHSAFKPAGVCRDLPAGRCRVVFAPPDGVATAP